MFLANIKSSSERAVTQWSGWAVGIKERVSAELPTSACSSLLPLPEHGVRRMRGTVLALALLALLVAAREGRGEGNTVRLCGRDFVRAVVFTCGGSRWKRHLTDDGYLFGKY